MPDTDHNTATAEAFEANGETATAAADEGKTAPEAAEGETNGSEAKPDKQSQREQRKTPRRPVSQAVVRTKVKLRSRQAQQTFRRSYNTAARASYTLAVMLRIYASDAEAEGVGAIADEMLTGVRDEIAAEIARMEIVLKEHGIEGGAVDYTEPEEFDAEVSSPRASQFLMLLGSMDRFIGLMDLLWLSGVYTDTQYHAGCYQWQRRMTKLANRLRNLAQRSMALARRDDDDSRRSLAAELLGHSVDEDGAGEDIGDDDDDDATIDAPPPPTPAKRARTTKTASKTKDAEAKEDA